ncbi:MAG: alanine--tRNA ligase, partial [Planctomycetota bacterium]
AQAAELLQCDPMQLSARAQSLMQSIRDLRKQLASGHAQIPDQPAAQSEPVDASLGSTDYSQQRAMLRETSRILNVSPNEIPQRIAALLEEQQRLVQQIRNLASSGAVSAESLLENARDVGGVAVIVTETPGATPNLMRQWIDQIRQKSDRPTAVLFASRTDDGKVLLVAGLSKSLVERGLSAGKWVGQVARVVGGGGGGRPDLAQAGGKQPEKIPQALALAEDAIADMLSQTANS